MITCRGHRPCSAQVYTFVPTTFAAAAACRPAVFVTTGVRRVGRRGVRRGVGHCLADAAVWRAVSASKVAAHCDEQK
jgi:hypothetical protein